MSVRRDGKARPALPVDDRAERRELAIGKPASPDVAAVTHEADPFVETFRRLAGTIDPDLTLGY